MRVLCDYHHNCLWESMELLAERLGWTLLRPIGMDWFSEGYWNHERKWHGDAVARQYLEPWESDQYVDGRWFRSGPFHDRIETLITLEQARDDPPDLVLSSLAHNHEGFARLATEVGATFALQIGNVRFSAADMAEDRWDLAAFGLISGIMPVEPSKPCVTYHQEFRGFESSPPPRLGLRISSFVQCYPQDAGAYAYWQAAASQSPEHDWRVYGSYGEAPTDQWAAGNMSTCMDVAAGMHFSDVAWHAKRWSDGFGHVIHNWFSVGRPVLGFRRYYENQLAGRLWIEGQTAWDIESNDIAALLRRFRDDEEFHLRACERAAARFREIVDYDEEEQDIRALLAQVLP
jgi:hypothetical protein